MWAICVNANEHPEENVDLVQCSMTQAEPKLFLLNLRFDYQLYPPSPVPQLYCAEAEE